MSRPDDPKPSGADEAPRGRARDFEPEAREDARTDMHVLHEPIMREKARPADGYQPIPLGLIFSFGALLLWGGWYLGEYNGNWRVDVFEPKGELALASAIAEEDRPAEDPMVLGRRVYNNCSACHQLDGAGVSGAFPPLAGSDWVTGSPEVLARILLHGMKGPVEVKGETYQGVMPAWAQLSDEEIAGVLTYIRSSWENAAPPIEAATVAEVREATAGRAEAWTAEELKALGTGP